MNTFEKFVRHHKLPYQRLDEMPFLLRVRYAEYLARQSVDLDADIRVLSKRPEDGMTRLRLRFLYIERGKPEKAGQLSRERTCIDQEDELLQVRTENLNLRMDLDMQRRRADRAVADLDQYQRMLDDQRITLVTRLSKHGWSTEDIETLVGHLEYMKRNFFEYEALVKKYGELDPFVTAIMLSLYETQRFHGNLEEAFLEAMRRKNST